MSVGVGRRVGFAAGAVEVGGRSRSFGGVGNRRIGMSLGGC